jgi:hypothetical protein
MRKMGSASDLGNERASETWWNKQGVYGRQASTYWSIALAAAVMGLVILGHRWQYERRQNHQLRLRLCAKEEVIDHICLLAFMLHSGNIPNLCVVSNIMEFLFHTLFRVDVSVEE